MDQDSLRDSPYEQTIKKYNNQVLKVRKVDNNALMGSIKSNQSPGRINSRVQSPVSQQKQLKSIIRQSSPQPFTESSMIHQEEKENYQLYIIEEQYKQLELKMQQITEVNEELNELLLQRIEEIEKFKQERQKMKQDIQQYHQKIVQISDECNYYKQQKELFIEEAKQIFEKKEMLYRKEYERQISQQKEQINALTKQIEDYQQEIEQKELDSENSMKANKQNLNSLQKIIKEKENALIIQTQNIEELKEQTKNYKEMVEKYKNLDSLSQQTEITYKKDIQDLQKQIIELKSQNSSLTQKISQKEAIQQDLESDLRKFTILCNEKEIALKQQNENFAQKYEKLNLDYLKKQEEITNIKFETERSLVETERINSKSQQQLEDKLIELISSLESTQKEFQKLQTKYDHQVSLTSEKEKIINIQEEQIRQFQTQIQEQQTSYKQMQTAIKSAETEKNYLKQDREAFVSHRQCYEKQINETKLELSQVKQQYEDKIKRYQEAIINYQNEIESLKINIDKLNKEKYAITSRTSVTELALSAEQKKHDQAIKQLLSEHSFIISNKEQILRDREININKLQLMVSNLTQENSLLQKQLQTRLVSFTNREIDNNVNKIAYNIQRQSNDIIGSARSGRSCSPPIIKQMPQMQQSPTQPSFVRYPGIGVDMNRSFDLLTENDNLNQKVLKRCKHIVGNF
ncbi:hypothetical protein ABPG74_016732 [Tetrahymena malaccensis]